MLEGESGGSVHGVERLNFSGFPSISVAHVATTVGKMPGSIQIVAIRGIPIRIHFTLLVLFGMFVYHLGPIGVPAALLLFTSTLLHELGHAFVAQRAGLPISSIELHLLGGTALMQAPKRPRHELVIALAGPAVSLGLGLVGLLLAWALGVPLTARADRLQDLLPFFVVVNLGMAVFNLLPALPMDGGRVLRALLALRRDNVVATRLAARVSRVLALSFVLLGATVQGWTFVLFGVVIYWLAGREVRAAEYEVWRASEEARLRSWIEQMSRQGLGSVWPPRSVRSVSRPSDPAGPVIDV